MGEKRNNYVPYWFFGPDVDARIGILRDFVGWLGRGITEKMNAIADSFGEEQERNPELGETDFHDRFVEPEADYWFAVENVVLVDVIALTEEVLYAKCRRHEGETSEPFVEARDFPHKAYNRYLKNIRASLAPEIIVPRFWAQYGKLKDLRHCVAHGVDSSRSLSSPGATDLIDQPGSSARPAAIGFLRSKNQLQRLREDYGLPAWPDEESVMSLLDSFEKALRIIERAN